MAISAVTREYTPGSCRNSKNPLRHPPRRELRLDSPELRAEQSRVPNQTHRRLDLLERTPESHQEHCHKTRRILMSTWNAKELSVPQINSR